LLHGNFTIVNYFISLYDSLIIEMLCCYLQLPDTDRLPSAGAITRCSPAQLSLFTDHQINERRTV
jgi:hypothetical protein